MDFQSVRFVAGDEVVRVHCRHVPRTGEYLVFSESQNFVVDHVSHAIFHGTDGVPQLLTSVMLRPLE